MRKYFVTQGVSRYTEHTLVGEKLGVDVGNFGPFPQIPGGSRQTKALVI